MSVTVATVAKKVVEVLASSKKGLKFLGYVVGIALFIVLLPVLMLYGLFGWMAGDAGTIIDRNAVIAQLSPEQQAQLNSIDSTCDTIVSTFKLKELPVEDQRKASSIYMEKLVGLETQDNFYNDLADCFLNVSETKSVYTLISEKFLVVFTEEEIANYDEMYGVTPVRVTQTTTASSASSSPTPIKGKRSDQL